MRPRPKLHTTLIGVLLLLGALTIAALTLRAYVDPGRLDPRRALGQAPEPTTAAAPAAATPRPPSPAATPTPRTIPPDLALSAQAAILVDVDGGAVRYERKADEPLPPASTAKIVTALTAMASLRPEEVVVIQPEDVVDPEAESTMGLQAGDTVTVRDLLVGLLLPSGNDAANALAREAGGRLSGQGTPSERFVAAMNATAARLGMADSTFASPAGLDADGQRATARDLARAARALLDDPALLPIVAMPRATVRVGGPQARAITVTSTNLLLGTQGVYGIKTGTTEQAGECLIFAYRDQGEDVIGVLLGSQDRFGDARVLLGLPPAPAATATPTPIDAP